MADKPTLGYWNILGRADPIRTMLTHLGVEFEDKQYVMGDESPESWGAQKPQLGIQFPNMPYWKDGDVFHSEHVSIMTSIARKYKPEYLGRTLAEQGNNDCYINAIHGDIMKWFMPNMFAEDQADRKTEGIAEAKALVEKFAGVIGDKKFLCGSELTVSDFFLYWVLKIFKWHDENNLSDNAKIQEYFATMDALPGVAEAKAAQAGLLPFAPIAGWQKNNMPA